MPGPPLRFKIDENLPTALSQSVQVRLMEVDGTDEVEIQE